MTSLPSRTSLEQLTCFLLLVPGFLYSQVIIREKVEIKPHPALRSTQAACAAEIRVESSFDGEVDPDLPHLIWLKGPCGVDAGSGSVSGSLTAPSYEGIYKAGYRFTNPAGGSGGQFRFAVYLGDSLVREFKTSVSCPTGCTLFDEWTIQLFAGFTFWPQYAVIGSGGTNTFAAVESTSTLTCSPGAWITDWSIELEITKGRDVGSFVDGAKRSYTVVKKKSQFSTFTFVADGEKGYGDVEITARSAGITVVKGFKVIAPLPKVKIVPPWWWYGGPIKLAFDNLPVLEFGEIHTPGPGQKFEPVITWEPDDTINTANYFNLVDELYVKVRAENAGGVARDSVKLVFETECIRANFDPSELSVGDTARLSFQRVKEDGTVEDLPRGLYTFSVTIVAGQDSSKGWFVTEQEEPEGGTTLLNASAPILYIAPSSIPDTSMSVQVLGSAWEVMWWKKGEIGNRAPRVQNLDTKQAEAQDAETGVAKGTEDLRKQVSIASLRAALSSSWCPVSGVRITSRLPELVIFLREPKEEFLIDKQPKMPDLEIAAFVKNAPLEATFNYFWKMTVKWTDPFGKGWEAPQPFVYANTSQIPTDIWKVQWNDTFVGGDEIRLEARVTTGGGSYEAKPLVNTFKILGENPTKEEAIAGLNDHERAVMYIESRYRQFATVDQYPNKKNYPLVNINYNANGSPRSVDRGIKQINSQHEKGGRFNLTHVWNWRENKALGKEILEAANASAERLPGRVRENKKEYKAEAYRGCPDFPTDSVQYLWKETFKRYNGGNKYDYWEWKPEAPNDSASSGHWQRIDYPEKLPDGRDNPAFKSSKYADDVWSLVQNKPHDW